MNIIPIRDLKNTVKIEQLCQTTQAPVFVTKNGYGSLVVMDIEYYTNTISKLEEAKILFEGLEDIKTGKLKDGEEVLKNLKDKYELNCPSVHQQTNCR